METPPPKKSEDAAINAIRQILGQGGTVAASRRTGADSNNVEPDSFFGMKILEAAIKYFAMVKRPQKAPQIAEAIERGGYINRSKNLVATVYTTLRREEQRDGGAIVQTPDKAWALTDW